MSGPKITGASKVMTGTRDTELILINEAFYADRVARHELDTLLANGWRHFGERFQRYSLNYYKDEIRRVLPLRVRLSEFLLSKSQRRILRRMRTLSATSLPQRSRRIFTSSSSPTSNASRTTSRSRSTASYHTTRRLFQPTA